MKTSFVAFLNKRGIACASDTDMTLYALSWQEPVVLRFGDDDVFPSSVDIQDQWLKALRDYDLQDMARLAESFIAMTSFERHMTFSQEGVGDPIDLAVRTKNNGFTWLNRKSWYHHKDVGGRYGKFGV